MPNTVETARQVNRHLSRLCEQTCRCLQAVDEDEMDWLADLLEQRQADMSEIDRLQAESMPPGASADLQRLDIERRDLLQLLLSLDAELIRLSALKRDAIHAQHQKSLNPFPGLADRVATGRLFSQVG